MCADLGSDVLTALEDIPLFEHVQGGGVWKFDCYDYRRTRSCVVVEHIMNLELDLFSLKEDDPPIIVEVEKGTHRLTFNASIVQRIFQASINYHSEKNGKTVIDSFDESNFGLTYTFALVEGSNHAAGAREALDLPKWLSPITMLSVLAAEFVLNSV